MTNVLPQPKRDGNCFELREIVQLDRKSWLRITVVVLSFLLIGLLLAAFLAFVPGRPHLPALLVGPVYTIILILGTTWLAARLSRVLNLGPSWKGFVVILSESQIEVRATKDQTKMIDNRNLRLLRTHGFYLEIESPNHGMFRVPEFVEVSDFNGSLNKDLGEGITALQVIDGQLRLEIRSHDGVFAQRKVIDF